MKTFFCFSAFCLAIVAALSSSFAQPPDSLWAHTYGGANEEVGYNVRQTGDGGYIVVGQTNSFGAGDADIWLLKTNANGDSLWSRTFGGLAFDGAYFVRQTTDSGFVLAGFTESFGTGGRDFWLVKTRRDPVSAGDPFILHPFCFPQSVQSGDGDHVRSGQGRPRFAARVRSVRKRSGCA
ncbi:MAG: hypothetical protein NT025_07940 [bacterium]|nr:hypothetical protein [bacterium]